MYRKPISIILLVVTFLIIISGCITVRFDSQVNQENNIEIRFETRVSSEVAPRVPMTSAVTPTLTVPPTLTAPTITQQATSRPTGQVPQFIETISIPSDTNAGIAYTAPQSGTYIFQYSDPPSAIWNGVSWVTEVLAFRGPVPQWGDTDPISLDYWTALFKIGGGSSATKQAAINSIDIKRGIVELRAGEVITLVVSDGKPWYDDNTGDIVLDVYALLSPTTATPTETARPTKIGSSCEEINVPYIGGMEAVTTQRSYEGLVSVTSSGIGKAGGDWVTDTFYLFIDEFGNYISPRIPNQYDEYILHINKKPAFTFIPGHAIPEYRSDHVYSFNINAPGGKLTLGVNDKFLADNTGSYEVTLCMP